MQDHVASFKKSQLTQDVSLPLMLERRSCLSHGLSAYSVSLARVLITYSWLSKNERKEKEGMEEKGGKGRNKILYENFHK